MQIKNVNFKHHTVPCDVKPQVGDAHRHLNKDYSLECHREKNLQEPHSYTRAQTQDGTFLIPCDLTTYCNLC